MSFLVNTLWVIFVEQGILKMLGFSDKEGCIITLKLVILILPLFTTSKAWKTETLCVFSPGCVPMSIMTLLERPNSSCVPDVTKTGVLSSICIKFSFSKRKRIKIALKTSENLTGFPAAFEDYFAWLRSVYPCLCDHWPCPEVGLGWRVTEHVKQRDDIFISCINLFCVNPVNFAEFK